VLYADTLRLLSGGDEQVCARGCSGCGAPAGARGGGDFGIPGGRGGVVQVKGMGVGWNLVIVQVGWVVVVVGGMHN
jgi:hypothetical protein